MGNEVLLYLPNQIGYFRLGLLFVSLLVYDYPLIFLTFYATSVALDAVDGIVARKYNQTSAFGAWPYANSVDPDQTALGAVDCIVAQKYNQTTAFGAWLDVVIDLVSRGALWCFLSKWGYFVMMVEWLTFLSTHNRGPNWKIPEDEFPTICTMVMAKGFKTPMGTYAITGIFVLPLWLYGMASGLLYGYIGLSVNLQYVLLVILIGGRGLALTTELFYIQQHIKQLLAETSSSTAQSSTTPKSKRAELQ